MVDLGGYCDWFIIFRCIISDSGLELFSTHFSLSVAQ